MIDLTLFLDKELTSDVNDLEECKGLIFRGYNSIFSHDGKVEQ